MYFWICLAIYALIGFLYGLFFVFVFEVRWGKKAMWYVILVYDAATILLTYVKMAGRGNVSSIIAVYGIFLFTVVWLWVSFKEEVWKKVLFFFLLSVMALFAEGIFAGICEMIHLDLSMGYDNYETAEGILVINLFMFIPFMLIIRLWNRYINNCREAIIPWYFLILPVSQCTMLIATNLNYSIMSAFNKLVFVLGAVTGFLADIIILYVVWRQNEAMYLEKSISQMERLREIEHIHYQSIEDRREELDKIRHDYNNQLLVLYHLLENKEESVSEQMLDELKEKIKNTSENSYCNNPVINAVLEEKEKIIREEDISFDIMMEDVSEIAIEPVHLCSIFSNAIDNAINAAKKCEKKDRFIHIRVLGKGDYLHVKVENSSLEPQKEKRSERRRYGQEILREIAQEYKGNFQSEWKNGVYTLILSFLAVPR